MNTNIHNALIGSYIAKAQIVNSVLLKHGIEIIDSSMNTMQCLERINSFVNLNSLDVITSKVESLITKKPIQHYLNLVTDDFQLYLSLAEFRQMSIASRDKKTNTTFNYSEWCYKKVCVENMIFDGDRKSDCPFSLSHLQLDELNDLIDAVQYMTNHNIHYTQQIANSLGHASFLLYALRARNLIFKMNGILPSIYLYADLDYAANSSLLETMAQSNMIKLRKPFDSRQKFDYAFDYQWDYISHIILHQQNIRTHYSSRKSQTQYDNPRSIDRLYVSGEKINANQNTKRKSKAYKRLNIGLHVREFGYKEQPHLAFRDTDPLIVIKPLNQALLHLSDKYNVSFNVFRFGCGNIDLNLPNSKQVNYMNTSFWKSTNTTQSMEVFLMDHIDMMVGTSSGPAHITHWLGIPTLFLESTNIGHAVELIDTKTLLSLKKIAFKATDLQSLPKFEKIRYLLSHWGNHLDILSLKNNSFDDLFSTIYSYVELAINDFSDFQVRYKTIKDAIGDQCFQSEMDDIRIDDATFDMLQCYFNNTLDS